MPMDDFYPGPGQYSEEGEEMETEETDVRRTSVPALTSVFHLHYVYCTERNQKPSISHFNRHVLIPTTQQCSHSAKHCTVFLSRPGLVQ